MGNFKGKPFKGTTGETMTQTGYPPRLASQFVAPLLYLSCRPCRWPPAAHIAFAPSRAPWTRSSCRSSGRWGGPPASRVGASCLGERQLVLVGCWNMVVSTKSWEDLWFSSFIWYYSTEPTITYHNFRGPLLMRNPYMLTWSTSINDMFLLKPVANIPKCS